jgi:hypothetical protein
LGAGFSGARFFLWGFTMERSEEFYRAVAANSVAQLQRRGRTAFYRRSDGCCRLFVLYDDRELAAGTVRIARGSESNVRLASRPVSSACQRSANDVWAFQR